MDPKFHFFHPHYSPVHIVYFLWKRKKHHNNQFPYDNGTKGNYREKTNCSECCINYKITEE